MGGAEARARGHARHGSRGQRARREHLHEVGRLVEAQRLEDGDLDFGFMASNWIGRARLGQPPFAKPIDLRMVAPANAGPLFFIVRADSPIKTVADLRGNLVDALAASAQQVHSTLDT